MQVDDPVARREGVGDARRHVLIGGEHHEGGGATVARADGHRRDRDPGSTEVLADHADHPRTVVVAHHEHVGGRGTSTEWSSTLTTLGSTRVPIPAKVPETL